MRPNPAPARVAGLSIINTHLVNPTVIVHWDDLKGVNTLFTRDAPDSGSDQLRPRNNYD